MQDAVVESGAWIGPGSGFPASIVSTPMLKFYWTASSPLSFCVCKLPMRFLTKPMAETSCIGFVDMKLSPRQAFGSWRPPSHEKRRMPPLSCLGQSMIGWKNYKIAFQVLHRYPDTAYRGEWIIYYLYIGINEHIFMYNTRIYHKDLFRQIITV